MAYRQNLDNCFAAAIGQGGLADDAWQRMLERAAEAMRTLKRWHGEDSLPLLSLPWRRDDLDACREAAALLTGGASDIVHFGTGGSSLGAQMLAQLAGYRVPGSRLRLGLDDRPRLHFFDNLDGQSLAEALASLDLETTRFLAVSKSGGTPETLVQLVAALEALGGAGLDPSRHVVVLTEPGTPERNAVRRLAASPSVSWLSITILASAGAIRCSPMSACCRRCSLGWTPSPCAKAPPKSCSV